MSLFVLILAAEGSCWDHDSGIPELFEIYLYKFLLDSATLGLTGPRLIYMPPFFWVPVIVTLLANFVVHRSGASGCFLSLETWG